MNTEIVYIPHQIDKSGLAGLPRIITTEGGQATRRFVEFFTANIRNRNTRRAYAHAVMCTR
ncbi:MAG: hypothetical protein HY314_08995 [Acidobacteria bacterium]|nr:hypothetical protein [Acidobacteriota bacterium]